MPTHHHLAVPIISLAIPCLLETPTHHRLAIPQQGCVFFITFEGKNSYLWRRLVGKILPLAELEGKIYLWRNWRVKKDTEPKAGKRMF